MHGYTRKRQPGKSTHRIHGRPSRPRRGAPARDSGQRHRSGGGGGGGGDAGRRASAPFTPAAGRVERGGGGNRGVSQSLLWLYGGEIGRLKLEMSTGAQAQLPTDRTVVQLSAAGEETAAGRRSLDLVRRSGSALGSPIS